MRALVVAILSFLAWGANPSWAQWPPGPYNFIQGQTYDLYYHQPAVESFLGGDIFVRYRTDVFDPIALLPGTPAALASMLSVNASPPVPFEPGVDEVHILVMPSNTPPPGPFGLDLPEGSLFGVRFQVKATAPTGPVDVPTLFDFSFGDPAKLDDTIELTVSGNIPIATTIAPIPEPQTWALFLAGLALVGAATVRGRHRS